MSISPCLKRYLDHHHVQYDVIAHRHTDTAFNSAKSAHISPDCMVKGVLLHDDEGYLMAALPSSKAIDMDEINKQTGRHLTLAEEKTLHCILNDCETGAVPALGEAFGVPTFWDKRLAYQPSFYLESGDHEELIRLSHFAFMDLMDDTQSVSMTH